MIVLGTITNQKKINNPPFQRGVTGRGNLMPDKYIIPQIHESIITRILTVEHRQRGLTLGQDEDFIYLFKDGHTVGVFFNTCALTIEAIHKEADRWCSGNDAISEMINNRCIQFGRG